MPERGSSDRLFSPEAIPLLGQFVGGKSDSKGSISKDGGDEEPPSTAKTKVGDEEAPSTEEPEVPDTGPPGPPPAAIQGSVMIHLISITAFFSIGTSMTSNVRPDLVKEAAENTARAVAYSSIVLGIQAVFSVILAPMFGALSDGIGRKPVLLASHIFQFISFALIVLFPLSLGWQVPAYVLMSMTSCFMTVARALIADIAVGGQNATTNYGYLGGAFGLFFLVGPAVGGVFEHMYTTASLHVACILIALGFIYTCFFLPETNNQIHVSDPLTTIGNFWHGFCHTNPNPIPRAFEFLKKASSMRWLALTYAASSIATTGVQSIIYQYVNQRLDWGPNEFATFLTIFGFTVFVAEAGVARFAVRFFGERYSIAGALASSAAGLCIYALADSTEAFYIGLFVGAFGLIVDPVFKGILARQSTPDKQGSLHGTFSAIADIIRPLSPIVANAMFTIGTQFDFSGLPLIALALVTAVSIAFAWIALSSSDLL